MLRVLDDSETWKHLCKHINDCSNSDPYKEVQAALDRGVDPNAADPVTGNQALHLFAACERPVKKSIELLLSHGADVHACNKDGHTPLTAAVFYANADAAERILKRGADPNVKYYNAVPMLFHAADFGHPQLVAILLRYGANPGSNGPEGHTALSRAFVGTHDHVHYTRDQRARAAECVKLLAKPLSVEVTAAFDDAMAQFLPRGDHSGFRSHMARVIVDMITAEAHTNKVVAYTGVLKLKPGDATMKFKRGQK